MGTPRPPRVVLTSALALTAAIVVGACGTSQASSSGTTSTTSRFGYHATTTLSVPMPQRTSTTSGPTLPPVVYVQTACRSFDSFSVILQHVPEYGSDAAGEIGGMADEVGQADQSASHWTALQSQLEALEAYAASPAWGEFAKKVDRNPRYRAVVASCSHIS